MSEQRLSENDIAAISDLCAVAEIDLPTGWDDWKTVLMSARNVPRLLADRWALLAELAAANATIAEQTHRADAAEGEAAVWRERCESREELLRDILLDIRATEVTYVPKQDPRHWTRELYDSTIQSWRTHIEAALLGSDAAEVTDG